MVWPEILYKNLNFCSSIFLLYYSKTKWWFFFFWVFFNFNSYFLFQLLGIAFQFNAIDLIMHYINLKENKDVRLAFEALKVRNFIIRLLLRSRRNNSNFLLLCFSCNIHSKEKTEKYEFHHELSIATFKLSLSKRSIIPMIHYHFV